MHPILFSIGKIHFYSYGFMASISFLTSVYIFYLLAKKNRLWNDQTFNKLIGVFLFLIFFARFFYFITYYNEYYSSWLEFFELWNGGLVSYGGIFGIILGFVILFRKNIFKYLDHTAIACLGGGIFWRVGGILAGSYPTEKYTGLLSINNTFPAIQLEIALLLIGFIGFWIAYQKIKTKNGMFFAGAMIYYGLIRILVDTWRNYWMLEMNLGQIGGIIMMIIGIIIGIYILKRNKN